MAQRRKSLIGPLSLIAGLAMLATQVYAVFVHSVLFIWPAGVGISLVLIGAFNWFYSLEERQSVTELFHDKVHDPNEMDERSEQAFFDDMIIDELDENPVNTQPIDDLE